VDVTETVTITTVVPGADETGSASPDPNPVALTEHYSPVGTSSSTAASVTLDSTPSQTSQSSAPTSISNGTISQGGSGHYKNTVYFTNWCVFWSPYNISYPLELLTFSGVSMEPISNPRTFLPPRSPMFYTRLLISEPMAKCKSLTALGVCTLRTRWLTHRQEVCRHLRRSRETLSHGFLG
jgi:hypothetical protein